MSMRLVLLLLVFASALARGSGTSPAVGSTVGGGKSPRFKYAAVSEWQLQADSRPGWRGRGRRAEDESAPYGSHITVSFRTTGHFSRFYRNITLELHTELIADHHRLIIDDTTVGKGANTAYLANLPDGAGWIRLTLVKGDPALFHAFVYHYDTEDLVVVEPVDASEVSQFSDAHDPDEHHRQIRVDASRTLDGLKMVAYQHMPTPKNINSDGVGSNSEQAPYHHIRRFLSGSKKFQAWHRANNQINNEDNDFRARRLGTLMSKQLRDSITTYQGPYGTASGCPATQQKVTIGVAVDAGFYAAVSGSSSSSATYADRVHAYITNIINMANVLYADQINVFLVAGDYVLKTSAPNSATSWNQKPYAADQAGGSARGDYGCYVSRYEKANHNGEIHNPRQDTDRVCCGYTSGGSGADTDYSRLLDNFKDWVNNGGMQSEVGSKGASYGVWHHFTNCFALAVGSSSTVGLAYRGTTCGDHRVGWSTYTASTWETFAHEVGHNFDASHTFNSGGIMSYDSNPEFTFSGQNPNEICTHIQSERASTGTKCYQNFLSGTCGNGLLEPGEECDDGGGGTGCCASDCTLEAWADCSPATNYIGADGQVKASTNECCTSVCKPTGTQLCQDGAGFCRNGKCETSAVGIQSNAHNSNKWCFYGNWAECAGDTADRCKVTCELGSNGCKSLDWIRANLNFNPALNWSPWVMQFKNGDVCETSGTGASAVYKVCENGACVSAVDPNPVGTPGGGGGGTPDSITVTTPLSAWQAGNLASVSWSTSASLDASEPLTITLEDGVSSPVTLVSSTPNDGIQSVSVPDSQSGGSGYTVCVKQDASSLKACSASFQILAQPSVDTVTLTPLTSGGVTLGTSVTVLWTTTGAVSNVGVQLRHSGSLVQTLISSTTNDGSFTWNIPSSGTTVQSGYAVRVYVATDIGNRATSSTFAVYAPSSYTMITPNAATVWERNQAAEITWQSAGSPAFTAGAVKLTLCQASANPVELGYFTQDTANDGSYAVSSGITNGRTAGTGYFIRITDKDSGSIVAETPQFRIVDPAPDPAITVTAPTSTTTCRAGTGTCQIAWSTVGAVGSTVTLEYVKSGASVVIDNAVLFGASPYAWSVPASGVPAGTGYYIRVTSNSNAVVNDVSDAFEILPAPSISVIVPAKDDVWVRGAGTKVVLWSSEGIDAGDTLRIRILNSGGSLVSTLAASTANDGSFTVPLSDFPVAGTGYQIELSGTGAGGVSAVLSGTFDVQEADMIVLGTLPAECVVGEPCNIAYSTTGTVANVKITYVITSGGSGTGVVVASLSKTTSPYVWTIPAGGAILPPCSLKIRVEDVTNAGTSAASSDDAISILAAPKVTIVSPSASTNWVRGSAATVLWSTEGALGAKVDVKLERNGQAVSTLASSISRAAGSYTVLPSQTLVTAGSGYIIRVTVTEGDNTGLEGLSASFSIIESDSVSLSAPSSCTVGTTCSIQFVTQGSVGDVKITYTHGADSGTLVASTASSPYVWTIPSNFPASTPATQAVIRVEDARPSKDTFDTASLVVYEMSSITVQSPSALGGTKWTQGSASHRVEWSHTGRSISSVSVVVKNSAGNVAATLTSSTANDGVFEVSGAQTTSLDLGTEYTVVVNGGNGIAGTSGKFDVVAAPPTKSISSVKTTPSTCISGQSCDVSWVVSGGISNVRLTFSGHAIGVITESVAAQAGTHTWNVPADTSPGTYFITVIDAADSSTNAISLGFTIKDPPTITFLSPVSDVIWTIGQEELVRWTSNAIPSATVLQILVTNKASGDSADFQTTGNTGSFAVEASATSYLAAGTYTVTISHSQFVTVVSDEFEVRVADAVAVALPSTTCSAGQPCSIAFTTQGTVSAVKLSYTGASSGTIIESVSNSPHVWNIPASLSPAPGSYVLHVESTDSALVSASSASFTIHDAAGLTVVDPGSTNNRWVRGADVVVEWTSSGVLPGGASVGVGGSIGAIVLNLPNGAGTIVLNAADERNDGSFTVKASVTGALTPGAGFTLTVRSAAQLPGGSGYVTATSAAFTVFDADALGIDPPSSCAVGSVCSVAFTKIGTVNAVKITWTRGGAAAGTAVDNLSAGSPFLWTIDPGFTVGEYTLTISSTADPSVVATATLTIIAAPSISVILPAKNSVVQNGKSFPIVWSSEGEVVGPMSVRVLRDGHPDVVLTDSNGISNDGSFIVSSGISTSLAVGSGYTVQVSDMGGSGATATSPLGFEVKLADGVLVTTPAQGAMCVRGQACMIAWKATGTVTAVDVTYSGGGAASGTIGSNVATSVSTDNSMTWDIPLLFEGTPGDFYITVDAGNGVAHTGGVFQILPPPEVAVSAPVLGDTWTVGKPATVSFQVKYFRTASTPFDTNSATRIAVYSLDAVGGESLVHVIEDKATPTKASGATATNAEYAFAYASVEEAILTKAGAAAAGTRQFFIRVSSSTLSGNSGSFLVVRPSEISVTAPAPAQTVVSGSTTGITWTISGGNIANVRLELLRGGGSVLLLSNSWSGAWGAFSWTVPAAKHLLPANNYQIKISDASDPSVFHVSSAFRIEEPKIISRVISPATGAKVTLGVAHDVTWAWSGVIGPVSITLRRGGKDVYTIAPTAQNDGAYSWLTASDRDSASSPAPGSGYSIRVAHVDPSSPTFADSGEFTIGEPRVLRVTAPDANTPQLLEGAVLSVWWTASGSDMVKVEVVLRNGANSFEKVLTPAGGVAFDAGAFDITLSEDNVHATKGDPYAGDTYDVLVRPVAGSSAQDVISLPSPMFSIRTAPASTPASLLLSKPPSLSGSDASVGFEWDHDDTVLVEWGFTPSSSLSSPSTYIATVAVELYHARLCPTDAIVSADKCVVKVTTLVPAGTSNVGTAAWKIDVDAGTRYMIKIVGSGAGPSSAVSVTEWSSEFAVVNQRPKLTLISVFEISGDSEWSKGSIQRVRWSSQGTVGQVKVSLLACAASDTFCAAPTPLMDIGTVAAAVGLLEWKVPNTSPPSTGGFVIVRIASSLHPNTVLATSSRFEIVDETCAIEQSGDSNVDVGQTCTDERVFTVILPSSASSLSAGSMGTVVWTVTGQNKDAKWIEKGVSIMLVPSAEQINSGSAIALATNVENTGFFSFIVPTIESQAGTYKIMVLPVDRAQDASATLRTECPESSSATRCSSSVFTITVQVGNPSFLAVKVKLPQATLQPERGGYGDAAEDSEGPFGNLVHLGDPYDIVWSSRGVAADSVSLVLTPSLSITAKPTRAEHVIATGLAQSGVFRWHTSGLDSAYASYPSKAWDVEARAVGVTAGRTAVSFAIAMVPSLTVTDPGLDASVTMVKGSVYDVDWVYTGAPFDVRVFLYKGNYAQRRTVTGALCVFPFYYQGKTHTRCARDSGTAGFLDGDEWCPTNVTGQRRDAGHRERCEELRVVGQIDGGNSGYGDDGKGGSLEIDGVRDPTIDVDLGGMPFRVSETGLPVPGAHYFFEVESAVRPGTVISRSGVFSVSCASYDIELTLKAGTARPSADATKAEIVRLTGLDDDQVAVTSIGMEVPIILSFRLGAPPGGEVATAITTKKCPSSGLPGLADFPGRDPGFVVESTLVDFSTSIRFNATRAIDDELDVDSGGEVSAGNFWTIVAFSAAVAVALIVFSVIFVRSRQKRKRAQDTHRESRRMRKNWREARTHSQRVYYYNAATNESSWEPPSADQMATTEDAELAAIELPPGWRVMRDQTDPSRLIYYHDDGHSTSWTLPDYVPAGWTPPEHQWAEYTIEDGTSYFFNHVTGTSQWDRPANVVPRQRKSRLERLQIMKSNSGTGGQAATVAFEMDGLSGVQLRDLGSARKE